VVIGRARIRRISPAFLCLGYRPAAARLITPISSSSPDEEATTHGPRYEMPWLGCSKRPAHLARAQGGREMTTPRLSIGLPVYNDER
jgi:hypothetical protein